MTHRKSRQGHSIMVFGPNERACYQYRTKYKGGN